MRCLYYCALATVACAVSARARQLTFTDGNMPIRLVDTSHGIFNHERVDYVEAVIQPHHVNNNGRLNFPSDLDHNFVISRATGDERGHFVASQFSGPAEWYNLSPQNPHVNRNDDYQAITTEWYRAECKVRTFLNQGANRHVNWNVRMIYVADSNRPDQYNLTVNFIENGEDKLDAINVHTYNPFLSEEKTFWSCKGCGTFFCKSIKVFSD